MCLRAKHLWIKTIQQEKFGVLAFFWVSSSGLYGSGCNLYCGVQNVTLTHYFPCLLVVTIVRLKLVLPHTRWEEKTILVGSEQKWTYLKEGVGAGDDKHELYLQQVCWIYTVFKNEYCFIINLSDTPLVYAYFIKRFPLTSTFNLQSQCTC